MELLLTGIFIGLIVGYILGKLIAYDELDYETDMQFYDKLSEELNETSS